MFYFIGKGVIEMRIKKLLSGLLVIAMLLTAAPLSGFAGLKLDLPGLGVGASAISLPSTSPANAAFSLDRLCDEWKIISKHLKSQ